MAKFKIEGNEVDEIVDTLITRKYEKTKPNSQNHGKAYKVFSYQGKGFIVHQDSPFLKEWERENVHSVTIDANDEGKLALVGFQTISKAVKRAETAGLINYYSSPAYKPTAMVGNPEDAIA